MARVKKKRKKKGFRKVRRERRRKRGVGGGKEGDFSGLKISVANFEGTDGYKEPNLVSPAEPVWFSSRWGVRITRQQRRG